MTLAAGILLLPIIIRTIGSGPYGAWLLITAVATYLQYSDLGVGAAIVHFSSRARAGDNARNLGHYLSAGLLWNASVALVAVPAYIAIASLYMHSADVSLHIRSSDGTTLVILGALMLSGLVIRPFTSALTGSGLLPVDRRNQSAAVIVRVIGTLMACLIFGSIVAVAIAETIATLIPPALAVVIVTRRHLAVIKWNRATFGNLRFMLSYSLRSFSVSAVGALILQAGTVLVGVFLGPGQVTYFNAAFRIYSSVRQLMSWLTEPFRSSLSRLFTGGAAEGKSVLFGLCVATLGAGVIGCGTLALSVFGIIPLWLGTDVPVVAIATTTAVLLAGLAVNSIQITLAPAGDAIGRPGAFFWIQCLWLTSFVALGSALAKPFGITGVAVGLTLPLLWVTPLYLIRARRIFDITLREWSKRVAIPVSIVAAPGIILAGCYELIATATSLPHLSFLTGGAFLAGVCASFAVFRRYLPIGSVINLFRTAL